MNKNFTIKKLAYAGFFIAIAFVLPFITSNIPSIGSKLLPMHIPVLIAGFICDAPLGLIVGFISPLLRSLIMGMPPLFPTATAMAFELATYGFMAGFLYKKLPKNKINIYISLILAMLGGRIIWGIVQLILLGLTGATFTWQMFMAGSFINAIPGIILQIVLIPIIIIRLERGRS